MAAALNFHRLSPFRLDVMDRYEINVRRLDIGEDEERNVFQENLFHIRPFIFFEPSRTVGMELAYVYENRSFPGEEDSDRSTRHAGQIFVEKRWSPHWRTSARVEGGRSERRIAEDFNSLSVTAGLAHAISPVTDLTYYLTWEQREYDSLEEKDVADLVDGPAAAGVRSPLTGTYGDWFHHAKLTRQLAREGSLTITYDDTIDDWENGETLRSRVGQVGLNWRFDRDTSAGFGFFYERRWFLVEDTRSETAWGPNANVSWLLTRWASFQLGGSWRKSRTEFDLVDGFQDTGASEIEADRVEVHSDLVFFWKNFRLDFKYSYLSNDSTEARNTYGNNIFSALLTGHF
jgi:hypothetical protein